MQVFVPTTNPKYNADVLDWRRRNKQIIESRQIGLAITNPDYGWQHHPAVNMWRGHLEGLFIVTYWFNRAYYLSKPPAERRNHKAWDNMQADHPHIDIELDDMLNIKKFMPDWWGRDDVHDSHASRLIQKDEFYKDKFYWIEDYEQEYVWPV